MDPLQLDFEKAIFKKGLDNSLAVESSNVLIYIITARFPGILLQTRLLGKSLLLLLSAPLFSFQ